MVMLISACVDLTGTKEELDGYRESCGPALQLVDEASIQLGLEMERFPNLQEQDFKIVFVPQAR